MSHLKIVKAKNIVAALIIIAVSGCSNSQTNKKASSILVDTTKTITTDSSSYDKKHEIDEKETEISIKKKSDYSDKFIEGLKKLREKKVTLSDSLLILNDTDTIYFPETPEIGRRITLTGKKDNLVIAVTIKRFNYTTIDYKIEITEFGKSNHNQSGKADIASNFYFGDELEI